MRSSKRASLRPRQQCCSTSTLRLVSPTDGQNQSLTTINMYFSTTTKPGDSETRLHRNQGGSEPPSNPRTIHGCASRPVWVDSLGGEHLAGIELDDGEAGCSDRSPEPGESLRAAAERRGSPRPRSPRRQRAPGRGGPHRCPRPAPRPPHPQAGLNTWYVVAGGGDVEILKAHNGIVQEVGIVDGRLAATRGQQVRVLRFF